MIVTVIELVEFSLKQEGYDGLYDIGGECACEIGDGMVEEDGWEESRCH